MEFLGRAVQIRPDFAEAQNSLGTLLEKQGKLEEAAHCYRQARPFDRSWRTCTITWDRCLRHKGG